MTAAGIIFSNLHDQNISEITRVRTMASVPFGCRYRLVDFALSNMVNSDITNVGIVTHYNYQSLMDHLGSGKDWDLARRTGGLRILPPYITAYANNGNKLYTTRLEALKSIQSFILKCTEDYIVLSDCDVICNIDMKEILSDHEANDADITIAVKKVKLNYSTSRESIIIETDKNNRVKDLSAYPNNVMGMKKIDLNIMVIKREVLKSIVLDSIAHNYTSFTNDIIAKNLDTLNIRAYEYNGYFAKINTMLSYFNNSMEILQPDIRKALFAVKNRPIYTKVRNSPPSRYDDDAVVKNSLVADGCIIKGTVENSILFRGVKVGKNTVVKNSILFQDTYTGENVSLNYVIADKNVVVRDRIVLSGCKSKPFYIERESTL